MYRVTVSLDDDVAALFDEIVGEQGYQSRSEAVRDLIRKAIEERRQQSRAGAQCVASLSFVYNHRTRSLAQKLLDMQHEHHDLVVATTHAILDHDSAFETMILKGPTDRVRALADAIRAERGVRFGEINLVSVDPNDDHVPGVGHHHHHGHSHVSPYRG